jgi:hypothetical protein
MGSLNGGRCRGRLLVIGLIAFAVILTFGVAAQSALAWGTWTHSSASSCASCHPGGNTGVPGTNAACQGCHSGPVLPAGYNCWSCHAPGQAVTVNPCNGCHLYLRVVSPPGPSYPTAFSHPAHLGSDLEPCATCHTNMATNNPHHVAGPIAAPGCTDCHKSPKFDNAPVPHPMPAELGITDCATCHQGMTTTHPKATQFVTPTFKLAVTDAGGGNKTVTVTLTNGTTPVAGTIVWIEMQTPPATAWTIISAGGTAGVATDASGVASATTTTPPGTGTLYRAIAEGQAGPPVVLPAFVETTVVAKETITLKLYGLTLGAIKLGRSVTARGVITPKLTVAQAVKLIVQKRRANGTYANVRTLSTLRVKGAYSKAYRPLSRGRYRMRAVLPKTALHTAALSPLRYFRVK